VTDGILGQSVLLPEFTLGGGMERRSFLLQAAAVLSAELLETGSRHFVGSARAADGNDSPEDGLELKFADFGMSVRYDDLPRDVIASAKRVLSDTLACAFGAVGSEPADIAEKTVRKTFGEGDAATIIGYPRVATVEGALFVNGVLVRSLAGH
jgi:2-methylcitrate dehydratase